MHIFCHIIVLHNVSHGVQCIFDWPSCWLQLSSAWIWPSLTLLLIVFHWTYSSWAWNLCYRWLSIIGQVPFFLRKVIWRRTGWFGSDWDLWIRITSCFLELNHRNWYQRKSVPVEKLIMTSFERHFEVEEKKLRIVSKWLYHHIYTRDNLYIRWLQVNIEWFNIHFMQRWPTILNGNLLWQYWTGLIDPRERDLIKTNSKRIVLIDVGENDVDEFSGGVTNQMETESNGNIKMINLDGENTKYFYQKIHIGLNTVWHRIIKQSFWCLVNYYVVIT